MTMQANAQGSEWARGWPIAVVGQLGIAGCTIFAFATGVLMEPMIAELGWSRTAFSSAFFLQMLAGLVILPATGWLADRYGPRRIAILGLLPYTLSVGLLGAVGQPLWQWWALCLVMATAQGFVTQTIWISAVVGWFQRSRGLAIAVALSGVGLGSFAWPILAAMALEQFGWRWTFFALAAGWAALMVPTFLLGFRDPPRAAAEQTGGGKGAWLASVRSPTFLGLMLAGGLFSCAYFGATVNLVPIIKASGQPLATAARIAGALGLAAIAGRLLVGWLLDRFPTRPLAICVFMMLPLAAVALLNAEGSMPLALLGTVLIGFATGAEMDVVTFIAARTFGTRVFTSIYALFTSVLAISASLGPLLAGYLFDRTGSYAVFLMAIIPLGTVGALIMGLLPAPRTD
ncbi:MFS transporter [Novosphingobium sp.]|uniref:MFS transporter n=1 Tax=Novosphingobium sp. TaxID=1874826 RepID=UPI0035AE2369